jgi:hypothetical protein
MEMWNKWRSHMEGAKQELQKDLNEEGNAWKVIKSQSGVTIKKCEKKDFSVPTFKGEGIIGVSSRKFFEEILLNQNKRRKIWNPSHLSSNTLDTYEQNGAHFELYTDSVNGALGGIISARDFVCCRFEPSCLSHFKGIMRKIMEDICFG